LNLLSFLLSERESAIRSFTIRRVSTSSIPTVLLVSGTVPFLLPYLQDTSGYTVGVLDSHFHGRMRNGRPSGVRIAGLGHVCWHRVRHTSVGGSTLYCCLFGTNMADTEPQVSLLRRTIRHYLDHSIRPAPWSRQFDSDPNILTDDDLLHPASLNVLVKYPTSFSHNGFGLRSLTVE
jgi:hypothetical protein